MIKEEVWREDVFASIDFPLPGANEKNIVAACGGYFQRSLYIFLPFTSAKSSSKELCWE